MARGFRIEQAEYVALLTHPERLILAQLAGDVLEMLSDVPEASDHDDEFFDGLLAGISQPALRPTDSAMLRLLPDASPDDEVAEEFRRFTESDLRRRKSERLRTWARLLLDADQQADSSEHLPLVVIPQQAEPMSGAMTDMRLVLADRLEITDESAAEEVYARMLEPADGPDAQPDDRQGLDRDEADAVRDLISAVFAILGLLQESLVDCMLQGLPTEVTGKRRGTG